MKKLMQFKESDKVIGELQYNPTNLLDIRNFVGVESFRINFGGEVVIRTFGRNIATVNPGDYVVQYESGRFAVMTPKEVEEYLEVVETENEESGENE